MYYYMSVNVCFDLFYRKNYLQFWFFAQFFLVQSVCYLNLCTISSFYIKSSIFVYVCVRCDVCNSRCLIRVFLKKDLRNKRMAVYLIELS